MNPVALCNIKVGAQNTHMCWDTLLCQSLERAEQGWAGVCSLMTEIVPSSSLSSSKPFSRLLSSRWSLLEFAWITLRLDHFLDGLTHSSNSSVLFTIMTRLGPLWEEPRYVALSWRHKHHDSTAHNAPRWRVGTACGGSTRPWQWSPSVFSSTITWAIQG